MALSAKESGDTGSSDRSTDVLDNALNGHQQAGKNLTVTDTVDIFWGNGLDRKVRICNHNFVEFVLC